MFWTWGGASGQQVTGSEQYLGGRVVGPGWLGGGHRERDRQRPGRLEKVMEMENGGKADVGEVMRGAEVLVGHL